MIRFFFISDKKRGTGYRRDLRFGRTCNDHLVTDFREILRINARAKINSSRDKNIRGPASITTKGHTGDAAVGASFLSKICDPKEAIFRDCDCERRSRNDAALESCRKNKAGIQKKENNQPPAEMHFVRHMPGRRKSKLESIVATSTGV